ncbi:MAG: matrixin family metalloprotease [Deltaproteobacteria bacterium]|nr:matrixin family metalloprotease [Deltaproteobacteria bacterium]
MTRVPSRWLAPVLLAAWTGSASAYKCTEVPAGGWTLWWAPREVTVLQHVRCSSDLADRAACHAAITRSMASWTDVACTDFTFIDGGDTEDERAGYDWRHPEANRNTIVFREGDPADPWDTWPHQAGALAITTVTFNSRSGRILDADIEVNAVPRTGGRRYTWAICPDDGSGCGGANDVENTITHELGHVLGLDHPAVPDATMYASAQPGETKKRTLDTDDENGVCAIYPPGQAATPCVPATGGGVTPHIRALRSCDDTSQSPCEQRTLFGVRMGCAASGGGLPWAAALALLLLRWARRGR